jgi:hypothetical protein
MTEYDRVVTIVANGAYKPNKDSFPSALPKAKADGEAMAGFFRRYSFKILNEDTMYDQDLKAMRKQAKSHVTTIKVQKPKVAAYYFSGHGLQDEDSNNWFMPVDYVAPEDEDDNDILCMSPQKLMMEKLKGSADTQLIFIFDCCRQTKNSAIAKGNDALSVQAAEVAKNAVNKGGAGLSGLATIILFGARAFGFASDGGSATPCSVLTQAIVDTACDPSKITQPAVMFFMDVNEEVERLGGYSMSHIQGKFKFQFSEKSATTTSGAKEEEIMRKVDEKAATMPFDMNALWNKVRFATGGSTASRITSGASCGRS